MKFYLGTHKANWLTKTDVPLFISRRTLSRVKKPGRALGEWILDSGGFTELSMFGEWQTSTRQYANEVKIWRDSIGNLKGAPVQDWMCEPFILAKTGLTIREHQEKTIQSYFDLKELLPDFNWIPVIQGWKREDYMRHLKIYSDCGIDLTSFPLVGIGSVCRRQSTEEAELIIEEISRMGINLHGFGFKILGLKRVSHLLESSDSMAWSFRARRSEPLKGCHHRNCANCIRYALEWHEKISDIVNRTRSEPKQMRLLFV